MRTETACGELDMRDPEAVLEYLEHLEREVEAGRRLHLGIVLEHHVRGAQPRLGAYVPTPLGEGAVVRVLEGHQHTSWRLIVYVSLHLALHTTRERVAAGASAEGAGLSPSSLSA